ncbi:hypothetical protein [Vibrio gazogenes]|uniref:Uncharacterized protein n=1 Tax=Vibrio gazogenes TaxID=687 RepID=A0A1Z2SEY3_VIBGA|nr:hypothetical protein [Vibrio gazogenes]ASA55743.1 hypothetical protein BSQ33_08550 [Vibrio gazogenes]
MSEKDWQQAKDDEAKQQFEAWIQKSQESELKQDTYYGLDHIIKNLSDDEKNLIQQKGRLWVGVMETWSHSVGLKTRSLSMGLESGHFSFIAIYKKPEGNNFIVWQGSQSDNNISIEKLEGDNIYEDKKTERYYSIQFLQGKKPEERTYRVRQIRDTPVGAILTESSLYSSTIRLYLVPTDKTAACLDRLNKEKGWKNHDTDYGKFTPNSGMTKEVHSCVSSSDLMVNYVLNGTWGTTLSDKGWYNALGASYRNALKDLIARAVDKVAGTSYSWTITKNFASKSCMTWTT